MIELTLWEKEIRESFLNGNRSWVRAELTSRPVSDAGRKDKAVLIARITASFNDDLANQESFIRCLEG